MMPLTPLAAYLKHQGMPVKDARAICERIDEQQHMDSEKLCLAGFNVLMNHSFTLPSLAFRVASALNIPPDIAAPMGRAVDISRWEENCLGHPDDINGEENWYERLIPENQAAFDTLSFLNVVLLRRYLNTEGIDPKRWIEENSGVYNSAKDRKISVELRNWHIERIAAQLGIDADSIKTTIAEITAQEFEYGDGSSLPMPEKIGVRPEPSRPVPRKNKGIRFSDKGKKNANSSKRQAEGADGEDAQSTPKERGEMCVIDVEKIRSIIAEKHLDDTGLGNRYTTAIGGKEKTDKSSRKQWQRRMSKAKARSFSTWQSAKAFAYALDTEPENIARKLTEDEWKTIVDGITSKRLQTKGAKSIEKKVRVRDNSVLYQL